MEKNATEQVNEMVEKDVKKNGKKGAYIERVNYLSEKYKSSLFFIFLQLMIIIFLIFGYLGVKENTIVEVVLPKIVKDSEYGKLKIGIGVANELYYKVWGDYITNSILNINKKNVHEHMSVLEKMMLPSVYKEYKNKLESYKSYVITNDAKINYTELESTIKIIDGEAIYKSKGRESIKLGQYKKSNQICNVEVKMKVENYMLFLTSFQRNCADTNSESGKVNE